MLVDKYRDREVRSPGFGTYERRRRVLGWPCLQKCVVKFKGEIWLEIWNCWWEKSSEIWGEDFSACQASTRNFEANFGNFVSNFASFFGNFVQQKRGANIEQCQVVVFVADDLGFWGLGIRTSWQSSVRPKTLHRCLQKRSRKRRDVSPQSTCRAERNPGPRKPQIRNVQIRNLAVLEHLLLKFMRVSRFWGVWGHVALQQGSPSVSWNAALSCPLMASNYVKLYLVPISFWMLTIPWTFQEPKKPKNMLVVSYLALQVYISFCSVSDKSGVNP